MDPESSLGPQRGGTVAPDRNPERLVRFRRVAHIDFAFPGRPPAMPWVVVAAVLSIAASLAFDELCVHVATSMFPALRGFSHFHVADFAPLTVVGVLLACGGWLLAVTVSSTPRWLFLRCAVVVTVVLGLADVVLLLVGKPVRGVETLMVMHLGIAVLTYNLLVHVARVRPAFRVVTDAQAPALSERMVRRIWSSVAIVVAIELALGVSTIVTVPFDHRLNALVPARGTAFYTTHAAVGLALGIGAIVVAILSSVAPRMARIGALMGGAGTALGLTGGVCAIFHASRVVGMALMLIGVVAAGVGYMLPSLEAMGKAEAARAAAAREAMSQSQLRGPATGAGTGTDRAGPATNGHRKFHPPPH